MRRGGGWWRMLALAVVTAAAAGCGLELDGLYALPLERPPTEAQWRQLPPYRVEAVGGRTSAPSEAAVDADAVHVTTASCHHGSEAPPVVVELRAFWTPEALYLRAEWTDPTENRGPVWAWQGSRWEAASPLEDGLGILWAPDGEAQGFRCARYCHLEDWRMAGDRARAEYAMRAPQGEATPDMWVWRAGRGTVEGTADDATLGGAGRRGDGGGPAGDDLPNSVRHAAGAADWFGAEDAPRVHPPPEPGARAPGYLRPPEPPGRTEIAARSWWRDGRWTVELSRPLTGSDAADVAFAPGREAAFGLAILDAVARDHLAAKQPVRLQLVAPGELDRGAAAVKGWWDLQ